MTAAQRFLLLRHGSIAHSVGARTGADNDISRHEMVLLCNSIRRKVLAAMSIAIVVMVLVPAQSPPDPSLSFRAPTDPAGCAAGHSVGRRVVPSHRKSSDEQVQDTGHLRGQVHGHGIRTRMGTATGTGMGRHGHEHRHGHAREQESEHEHEHDLEHLH